MGEVIVITSGKGGVGKTTTVANIGTGLAMMGKKTVVVPRFSEQTLFISEERLLVFEPRPAIFQKKRWLRELHLLMSMV